MEKKFSIGLKKTRENLGSKNLMVYVPKSQRLRRLFQMQTELIEHKFPKNHIAEHEFQISNAGDIYRAMTEHIPDCGYIGQKLESLKGYFEDTPIGDFREFRELKKEPYYQPQRNLFLENLHKLQQETKKTIIDHHRKIMLAALAMIEALISWFESLNPRIPPIDEFTRLTNEVNSYCMKTLHLRR